MKRLLSGLLSLVMVFSLTPSTIAFADGETTETIPQSEVNGTTGTNEEETKTTTGSGTETGGTTGQNGGGETTPSEGSTSDLETKSNDNTDRLGTSSSNSSQSGVNEENPDDEDTEFAEVGTVITQTELDSSNYIIKSPGIYTIQGDITTANSIEIRNSEGIVTLNVKGNVNYTKNSSTETFLQIWNKGNVEINASNYEIKTEDATPVKIYETATVTINGGIFNSIETAIYTSGCSGRLNSKLTLNNCTFICNGSSTNYAVYVSRNEGTRDVEANGCYFNGVYDYDIEYRDNGNLTLKGKNNFIDNVSFNVYLCDADGTLTLADDFNISNGNGLNVTLESSLAENAQRKIAINTSKEKKSMITSSQGYYAIYKDDGIYFWNHEHTLDTVPMVMGNLLVENCTIDGCEYYETLATLNAEDVGYTGNDYKASITDSKSLVKNVVYTYQEKQKDNNYKEIKSAPYSVGEYKVIARVNCYDDTQDYDLTKTFKITNTITPSQTITIKDGGEYNVVGGEYYLSGFDAYCGIIVDTSKDVTLNILDDLTLSGSSSAFQIKEGSGAVNFNSKKEDGSKCKLNLTGMMGLYNKSENPVTFNRVVLNPGIMDIDESKSTKLIFDDCEFVGSGKYISAKYIEINNCTFSDSTYIYVTCGGNVKFKGKNTFNNLSSSYDVYLNDDSTITLDKSFTTKDNYELKVELYTDLADEGQRQITSNTDSKLFGELTSTQNYSTLYKDGNLYFWNHTHSWTYKIDGNVLTAKCDSEDCEYHKTPLTTTLTAKGGVYKNEAYTASVDNKNDNVTVSNDGIKYYKKDGETFTSLTSAPIDAGTYKAEIDVAYGETETTLTKEFTISKADQTAPTANDILVKEESVKGQADGAIKNKTSKAMEYSTDKKKYTSVDGFVSGLKAGKYYVRYAGDTNHNASGDLEVEIKSGKSLSVNVPEKQIGYTLSVDHSSVDYNGSSKITFKLADGYSKTKDFAVKVNGKEIPLDKNGEYTIKDIQSDQSITVEGVADITKPVISGIEDGKMYTKTKTFTVEDANLAEVKVDGVVVQADKDGKYTLVPKNGSYEISASDTAGNTTSITVTVNYEEVSVPSVANKTYTGKTLKADIEDSDLYKVTSNVGGTNVGTYSVELTLKDSMNYKWKDSDQSTVSVPFEITKAKAVVNVTSNTLTYNGEDQVLVTGSTIGGILYYQLSNGEWSTDVPVGNGAGTYVVKYKVDGGTNYNNTDVKSVEVVIGKADPKLSVSAVSEKMYGDKEFKLDVTKSGNGTLSYSSSNKDVVTVDSSGNVSIVGAGEATLTVNVDATSNYNYGTAEITVKVAKKGHSLVIDTLTYNKTYGDDSFSLGATSDGKIAYTSSDSKVATVDKDGTVSIVGKGTAMITVTVDEDSNYIGISKTVSVVVNPKSISNATVTLGNTLSYTGSEQTQSIKSVVVDGMTVDTYKVSGNVVTDAGNHTLTVTGTGNFSGTVSVDFVVVPTKAEQLKVNSDGKISYGKGTITVDGNVLNSKTDLVEMLIKDGSISSGELSSIYSGSELAISLKITDVSDVLSDSVKSSMKVSGFTLGNQFLDISLYKGEEKIHTTSGKVKITIDVPDELINRDRSVKRTYYVIRNHNGEVSSIDGTFNEKDQTFTFETDKFSAYALAYKDVTAKKSDTTKKTDQKKETKKKSTNTGVQLNMGLYIALIMISMIGLVVLVRKKRFE